ncbi:MAG TPA: hypothetical protein VJA82_09325 [Sediminibacterium sp.]|jgi:hypothetical protein|uniref:hypothetical protein n=1 Tax=unclassified Sediminibacterium TaxID=2635961 RepID=UPI0008C5E073|nr:MULTISPECIES: hypothetical protein [unclassified Sediminibacterium]OHC85216.1 MAG: hypothetical protein A2472_05410 [Sphingobacteriia bacterium RIFOXYC2_FULL_35_18]OHC89122.1 MAG: hypothetical protein A2546_07445 [Sphingobacteriia bacterium RIFOXYD2_FULL_35_12]OYZ03094.1 MAG: hypothetical protein B7Y37_01255 [Sphingobacteriia bacterium 28-36-52]MBW0162704.1 hypothetical protein [Sediminibacterium sp.]MBW0164175.1 hypothetical protein [Sediminibacterium sp.]
METDALQPKRYCLYVGCGKALDPKMRKDAKFCNEQCKAAHHNPRRADTHPDIKKINKILLKNFLILGKALGNKEYVKKKREQIIKQGFNLDYYTHTHKDFIFCYRYGYHFKDEGYISIFIGFDSAVYKSMDS